MSTPPPDPSELRPISYAVLALVGRGGASSPELVRMAEDGAPLFWTGAASQVYAEARRLTTLGYLSASREPGRTRPRTVYALTPRGLEAFRTWARTPATYPRIQHETAVRFLGLDLVEQPSQLLPALDALDEEITALEHHVNTLAERGASIPHRRLGISLQLSLAQKMLIAHREWLLEARTALAASVKL